MSEEAFTYNARQEEETPLFKKGEYSGSILKAEVGKSKKGNRMLTLLIKFYDGDRSVLVTDYLVDTDDAAWKTRSFSGAIGHDYMSGALIPADLPGQNLRAALVIEKQDGYADKNKVKAYVMKADTEHSAPEVEITDQDVPFAVLLPLVGLLSLIGGVIA